jgi:hypothetical protein
MAAKPHRNLASWTSPPPQRPFPVGQPTAFLATAACPATANTAVAPTAIAAVNVQGDTIHAFFNLPPVHIDPDGDYPTRDKARVVMENIRYKTPYFFSAEVFAAQPIIPVNLTKVRRQSDERFIEALNHIRANRDHREHVALFNRT